MVNQKLDSLARGIFPLGHWKLQFVDRYPLITPAAFHWYIAGYQQCGSLALGERSLFQQPQISFRCWGNLADELISTNDMCCA